MKKILLLFALLLAFLVKAQDVSTITKMEKSYSIEELKALSDKIAGLANTKLTFLNVEYQNSRTEKIVIYNYTGDGKNKDLTVMYGTNEAEGTYYFSNAFGNYGILSGFYVSTFHPTSSPEIVINNFKLREYRVNKNLRYKISELEPDNWTIEKTY